MDGRGRHPRTPQMLKNYSVAHKDQYAPKGDLAYNHKLTSEEVVVMRGLYPERTMRQLSKQFNTCLSNVWRIIHGEIWS